MPGGFVIAHTAANTPLDTTLADAVAEIRVEQELSKATKYAVRFEEDICQGRPTALSAQSLQPGEILAVLVKDEHDQSVCLVRGPITKLKSSSVLGGPGSWLEVHGEDRRIEMDRTAVTSAWAGTATNIVSAILQNHHFALDVRDSDAITFEDGTRSLNQSSPDLRVVNDLARRLNYEFWITYTVAARASTTANFDITETAAFKPSPDYGGPGGVEFPSPAPTLDMLTGTGEKVLRLNVPEGQCRNIRSFDLDVDVEKATAALIHGINDRSGEDDEHEAAVEQPPVDPEGQEAQATLARFHVTRTINHPGAGSAEDRGADASATLASESWFITARASTSAHLFPGVVQAHEIVRVEGTGFVHSGRYQVSKVLHVVNAWGHLMDLTLRRNALPEALYG
ncbi:MAG: hypothetical protein JOZ90_04190 [Alphaproteobacteria bacterium]|nr:hypothetical protein [Alphaproteobacteria bacterium]MBV9373192.1 hypothetical protein [Alphaproteobacteria bacterium]MBV9900281.1 hypothetical protein [Alphaproteobacteria bacterium]